MIVTGRFTERPNKEDAMKEQYTFRFSHLLLALLSFAVVAILAISSLASSLARKADVSECRRIVKTYAAPKTLIAVTREQQKNILKRLDRIDNKLEKIMLERAKK